MREDKNDKKVLTSIGGKLKKKEILRDENYRQVRRSTGQPLKNKDMFRDEKDKTSTYLCLRSI